LALDLVFDDCARVRLPLRPLLRVPPLRPLERVLLLRPLERVLLPLRVDPFRDALLVELLLFRFDDLDEPLRLDDVLASGITLLLLGFRSIGHIPAECRT